MNTRFNGERLKNARIYRGMRLQKANQQTKQLLSVYLML